MCCVPLIPDGDAKRHKVYTGSGKTTPRIISFTESLYKLNNNLDWKFFLPVVKRTGPKGNGTYLMPGKREREKYVWAKVPAYAQESSPRGKLTH